jgi:hypothetical protein
MTSLIALLLIQIAPAAAVEEEFKIYPAPEGYTVGGRSSSCIMLAEYNNGVSTQIAVGKDRHGALFSFRNKEWKPSVGMRYDMNIDFGDWVYDIKMTATENGFIANLHPDFLNTYAQSSGVDIKWGNKPITDLDLQGSSKAMAAFRLCMKEYRLSAAVPDEPDLPKAPVKTDPFDLSSPATMRFNTVQEYPVEANGAEGVTRASVKVDVNAKASDCKIIDSSDSAFLDAHACKIMLQGRYMFAKDRAGMPTEGIVEKKITFEDPRKTVKPE